MRAFLCVGLCLHCVILLVGCGNNSKTVVDIFIPEYSCGQIKIIKKEDRSLEWITCENTYEESWRRLLEYANVELAIEAIESIHGKSTPKTKENYKKQAEQVRVSLLQAKEYFDVARSSSLFTQPNHLYYGAVALSTACMLIRGDGTKSLDRLRCNSKNAHHGLDFSFSSSIKTSKQGIRLLEDSYVKVLKNGHFSNWYSTLISKQPMETLVKKSKGSRVSSNMEEIGEFSILDISELNNAKESLEFLIKRLPDLHSDLNRYGVDVKSARVTHSINLDIETDESQHIFVFHSSPSHEVLMEIVEQFECESGNDFCIDIMDSARSGIIKTKKSNKMKFSFPDSRETLDHKVIFFKENLYVPEVVDLFILSYALSMLSRYFPDIWVSFLESHCKGAKLVERIVRIITLKLPALMLNQLSGKNYMISTHRPFWH